MSKKSKLVKPGKGVVAEVSTPEPTVSTQPAPTPAVVPSKYRGTTTGMRVQVFQDWQLAENTRRVARKEKPWTDDEILDLMKAEFPLAEGKIFTADRNTRRAILRLVRALFNEGRHAKSVPKPDVPSVEYDAQGATVAAKNGKRAAA